MNFCAIDTATARLGVAVSVHGQYSESVVEAGLHHTERLTSEIQRLLEQTGADAGSLDCIFCASGPGSFTGLRIGMAAAKGLSFGNGAPLVSVPTLDLYARGKEYFPGTVVPIIDARKKRVYAGMYREGQLDGRILDCTPEELYARLPEEQVLITGPYARELMSQSPFAEHAEKDEPGLTLKIDNSALDSRLHSLVELGLERYKNIGADSETAGPLYIRRSEAEEARDT